MENKYINKESPDQTLVEFYIQYNTDINVGDNLSVGLHVNFSFQSLRLISIMDTIMISIFEMLCSLYLLCVKSEIAQYNSR